MSFTFKKFNSLSSLNRFKKAAYIIKQHIQGTKSGNSPEEILEWLNIIEQTSFKTEQNNHELGITTEYLLQQIDEFAVFKDQNIYDNPFNLLSNTNMSILLDNIRSPYNVGAIIRTASCMGCSHVYLNGITPDINSSKVIRTSMNAQIPSSRIDDAINFIHDRKNDGYTIYSLEKNDSSIDISFSTPSTPTIIIVGNEEFGISEELLSLSNAIIHIPLYGNKNSLNVSVATGIALYTIISKIKD